jgi:hypothetical protein
VPVLIKETNFSYDFKAKALPISGNLPFIGFAQRRCWLSFTHSGLEVIENVFIVLTKRKFIIIN